MINSIDWVFSVISRGFQWLESWEFLGVPFLFWIMGVAILGLLIDYIFG